MMITTGQRLTEASALTESGTLTVETLDGQRLKHQSRQMSRGRNPEEEMAEGTDNQKLKHQHQLINDKQQHQQIDGKPRQKTSEFTDSQRLKHQSPQTDKEEYSNTASIGSQRLKHQPPQMDKKEEYNDTASIDSQKLKHQPRQADRKLNHNRTTHLEHQHPESSRKLEYGSTDPPDKQRLKQQQVKRLEANTEKADSENFSEEASSDNKPSEATLAHGSAATPDYWRLKHQYQQVARKQEAVQEKVGRLEEKIPTKRRLHYEKPSVIKNQQVMKQLLKEAEEQIENEPSDNLSHVPKNPQDKPSEPRKVKDRVEGKIGRLSFQKEQLTEKKYHKKQQKKENRKALKRKLQEAAYYKTFQEADQEVKEVAYTAGGIAHTYGGQVRKHLKQIRHQTSPYTRLKFAKEKESVLADRLNTLKKKQNAYSAIQELKAARQETRKAVVNYCWQRLLFVKPSRFGQDEKHLESEHLKKSRIQLGQARQRKETARRQIQRARKQEGGFLHRILYQLKTRKKAATYQIRRARRTVALLTSTAGLLLLFLLFLFGGFLIVLAILDGGVRLYEATVVQSDYGTISDVTAYFQSLETDLREQTEEEKVKEDYPDCDEYVFQIGEIGHDPLTLISYLGAIFGDFSNLDIVKTELDALFTQMYQLTREVREESRETPLTDEHGNLILDENGNRIMITELKKICYVTLTVKPLAEVVEERMDDTQKATYEGYRLASGGQQVYGPVMKEDWTALVSSSFGERIHPVTGVRTFHNGVDVAVPVGTMLYAAVSGTVTEARYSDTAGYFVRVRNDNGWVVTFMHMDSLAVSAGQEVAQGDFVGYSGNTGRSTGPHLHLEVRDPSGNPVNPLFIIPSACVVREES